MEQVPLKHNGKKHLNIRSFCKPEYLLYARELLPFCTQKGNKLRKNSHLGERAHFIMSATKDEQFVPWRLFDAHGVQFVFMMS